MGIKDWFTRKSKVKLAVDKPKTILYDLYANSKENNDIYLKLQEIENTLNNIPAIPDLRDYAKVNQVNTFQRAQIIKETNPYINLVNQNGVSVGVLGKSKSGSNDVDLESKFGSANIKAAQQVILSAGKNYGVVMTGEIKQNNHVVNKKYVDDAINNIQQANINWENVEAPSYKFNRKDGATGKGYIQLSKNANDVDSDFIIGAKRILFDDGALSDYVYRFDRQNGGHSFAWPVAAYENPNMNSPFIATQDSQIITKKALDDSINNNKVSVSHVGSDLTTDYVVKYHIANNVFAYKIEQEQVVVNLPASIKGKEGVYVATLYRMEANGKIAYLNCSTNGIFYRNDNRIIITFDAPTLAYTDLYVGSTGRFQAKIYVKCSFVGYK